jgi:hypothetical protein
MNLRNAPTPLDPLPTQSVTCIKQEGEVRADD